MRFGEILSKSWKDYKRNFKLLLRAYWWFSVLPAIIFGIIGVVLSLLVINTLPLSSLASENSPAVPLTGSAITDSENINLLGLGGFIALIVIYVVVIAVLSYFISLTLYYAAFYNEKGKLTFKQAAKGGLPYFWRFVGLGLLILLIISLLITPGISLFVIDAVLWASVSLFLKVFLIILGVILLILGGLLAIYLSISWSFSSFVLIKENTRIVESMKKSKSLVKGRWWMVLGYSILIGLIMAGISWIITGVSAVVTLPISLIGLASGELTLSLVLDTLTRAISFIFKLAATIITAPFGVFFFKNFYLEMKKGKVK